jgi:Lipid A 3-O-deacylase (PagL)
VRHAASFLLVLLLPAAAVAQQPQATDGDDPFARRGWHMELAGHGALETWNYNISHEELLSGLTGITYGLGKGVVLKMATPVYYVWQRGTDGYLFGLTWGVRSRLLRRPRWSLFWEADVGLSESDTYVPPGGTRFNYLVLGGVGITWRLRPGLHVLGSLRWIHVSNNGLAGPSRNPDIEAVGPAAGVLVGF